MGIGEDPVSLTDSAPNVRSVFLRGRMRGPARYFRRTPRSEVLFADYFLMTDWSSGTLQILFNYYGFVSPGFSGFLGSLGLRDTVGGSKPAWEAWKSVP